MTSDFLADLDAVVQQQCACLCGLPITAGSPSAYFAREACANRWNRGTAGVPARQTFLVTTDLRAVLQQLGSLISDSIRMALAEVDAVLMPVARAMAKAIQQAARLAQLDRQPPDDPMQRALYLRRHRHTGPRTARRTPHRVDPGGGLRIVALGRPAYRPAC